MATGFDSLARLWKDWHSGEPPRLLIGQSSGICGFDSRSFRTDVRQLDAYLPTKEIFAGSNPVIGTVTVADR